jgi:hypothetical protein
MINTIVVNFMVAWRRLLRRSSVVGAAKAEAWQLAQLVP